MAKKKKPAKKKASRRAVVRTKAEAAAKKKAPAKKKAARKPIGKKKAAVAKKTAAPARKKAVAKRHAVKAKRAARPKGRQSTAFLEDQVEVQHRRAGTAGQSGGLQGISRVEDADSESVDELLEEGNTFEAGAVAGVEEADENEEREVHTHEVPEDDVPEEYLDKEQ